MYILFDIAQKHVQQSMSGTQYKHITLATDLASVVLICIYAHAKTLKTEEKQRCYLFLESGIFLKNSGMPVALTVLR